MTSSPIAISSISWVEPNRANTPPLHIASSGARYSTLTGVWWLNDHLFVVNHRSGLRVALFDLRAADNPMLTATLPHLTDDIAARKIGDDVWEVAVSGCWDAAFSILRLTTGGKPKFKLVHTQPHKDRTFCHGVAYGQNGVLALAYHTGANPHIRIGNQVWKLPAPWGARDICFDKNSGDYYSVAVSENPKKAAYKSADTSIWILKKGVDVWRQTHTLEGVHSDTCQVFGEKLWIPDQNNDALLGICIKREEPTVTVKSPSFDFPHGISVSSQGLLAVTNYGSSAISLIDITTM